MLVSLRMCRGCSKSNIVCLLLVPKIDTEVLGADKHNEDLLSTDGDVHVINVLRRRFVPF